MDDATLYSTALDILQTGVEGGMLDPTNPFHQVIVAGASIIVAATQAGLTPGEVFALVESNAKSVDTTDSTTESGGYL